MSLKNWRTFLESCEVDGEMLDADDGIDMLPEDIGNAPEEGGIVGLEGHLYFFPAMDLTLEQRADGQRSYSDLKIITPKRYQEACAGTYEPSQSSKPRAVAVAPTNAPSTATPPPTAPATPPPARGFARPAAAAPQRAAVTPPAVTPSAAAAAAPGKSRFASMRRPA